MFQEAQGSTWIIVFVCTQYQMACAHRRGQGVPQSDVEAARYDWKAAEQGHSEAQHNRAVSCTLGRGVTQNQEEGIKWHRKAAESGNVRSQHVLGIACLKGLGVARDIRKAIDYLQKASDKGYAKSQNCLAKIYLHGQPDVPQDVGLALCLFREVLCAMRYLGHAYMYSRVLCSGCGRR
jgi:TPR repeat protein